MITRYLQVLLVLALSQPTTVLYSQTIWLAQDRQIGLEALKPNLDRRDNTSFLTSAVFLTARLNIHEKVRLVGELPFAHGKLDFREESNNNLGNPYFGLELQQPFAPITWELGFRIPVAKSSFATDFVGFFSDIDRLEAFAVDNIALQGAINYQPQDQRTFTYRIRVGSTAMVQTEGKSDADLFLVFSGQLGLRTDGPELLGGLTGRVRVTKDGRLGQRAFLQLGLGAGYHIGNFRPGLHFKLPLESDLLEIIDYVFGLNMGLKI